MTTKKTIDKTAIIAAIIISIPGLLGVWMGYQNSHSIQSIHVSINSRMDELLLATKEASKAEGAAQERVRNK